MLFSNYSEGDEEKEVYVYKDPITDPGKKSKKGYITVNKDENGD